MSTTPIVNHKSLRMPQAMTEATAAYLLSLDWDNVHTKRLQQATGDPYICMAYSPRLDSWVLARRIDVLVGHTPTTLGTLARVPFVWKEWREDDTKRALSPNDIRLIPYVLDCDSHRGEVAQRLKEDMLQEEANKEKAHTQHVHTMAEVMAEDMHRRLGASLARDGVTVHRQGGESGGRISTAAIWKDHSKPLVTLT